METKKVALIVFYDRHKRILMQDRKGISKRGEEWGYFGGKIEEGETPEEAVVRETKEELDFDLQDHKFIGIFKNKVSDDFIVERYVFISPLEGKLSKFRQLEGSGMKLFSIEEAKKVKMVKGDNLVINRLDEIL
jgi:8-oxo-dGTP diphosphatase